jgi:hypothetical protein
MNSLLSSVLLVLRSINITSDFSSNALELLPFICKNLSFPPRKHLSVITLEAILSKFPVVNKEIIHYLQQNNVFILLLGQLAEILEHRNEIPDMGYFESLLALLIQLAQSHTAIEIITSNGLILLLNGFFPLPKVVSEEEVYTQIGERSQWHKMWCLVLDLIVCISRAFREHHNEECLGQVLEFVNVNQGRFFSNIQNCLATTSFARLQEAEKTTELLYNMIQSTKGWKLNSYFPDIFLPQLQHFIIYLFQRCGVLLQSTSEKILDPISSEERKKNPLMNLLLILRTIRNCLMLCSKFLPHLDDITTQQELIQDWNPLFFPSSEIIAEGPSFGTFLDCQSTCFNLIRKYSLQNRELSDPLQTEVRSLLYLVIEMCFVIVIQHMNLFQFKYSPSESHKFNETMATEFQNFIYKVNNQKPSIVQNEETKHFFKYIESFIKEWVGGKAY